MFRSLSGTDMPSNPGSFGILPCPLTPCIGTEYPMHAEKVEENCKNVLSDGKMCDNENKSSSVNLPFVA